MLNSSPLDLQKLSHLPEEQIEGQINQTFKPLFPEKGEINNFRQWKYLVNVHSDEHDRETPL